MRRLSMKTKRRKSETGSESESEENGVGKSAARRSDKSEANESEENSETEVEATPPLRKSAGKKRASRGRNSDKLQPEESAKIDAEREDNADDSTATEHENGSVVKRGGNKRRKKDDQKVGMKPSTSVSEASAEHEYEVEKIVGQRMIKGRRQFLIRWKGYGEDSDTWEQEKDLNCIKLIEEFLMDEAESENESPERGMRQSKSKSPKSSSEKTPKKPKSNARKQLQLTGDDSVKSSATNETNRNEKDSQAEFEVEKIIEVHFKKNKMREFLIRWKGFTSADDTWEPEKNLNCPELIAKFMKKVEKAKTSDIRELRTNPAHTKRYTLTTHETGRRLSRRNLNKQRATYHECDE